jgi:hypothetical protein
MVLSHDEEFREIDDLCCQLLLFVEKARLSESHGAGGILVYSQISECASVIRATAEKRRQMLSQAQFEYAVSEQMKGLDNGEFYTGPCSYATLTRKEAGWGQYGSRGRKDS